MTKTTLLENVLNPFKKTFKWCILFSLCINLLMLTVPLYLLQVFDRVLSSRSLDTLWVLTLIAVVALLTFGVLEMLRRLLLSRIAVLLEENLGSNVLRIILKHQGGSLAPHSTLGLRELTTLRNYVSGNALIPLLDAPWSLVFIAVIFILHPLLGWIAVGAFILLFLVAVLNEKLSKSSLQLASDDAAIGHQIANSAAQNTEIVSALGMASGLIKRWQEFHEKSLSEWQYAGTRLSIMSSISKVLRLLIQVATLGTGAALVLQGQLTAGGMIAGSILLSRALAPVEQLISSWGSTLTARKSYQALQTLLENSDTSSPTTSLPAPNGNIRVEAMSYIHPGQQDPILKSINFSLQAGESLGLIGPTGSGKTTLARLLIGILEPRLGNIRLDGMNISAWHEDDRGKYIGYLPQDLELFSGTVAENIARFSNASSEEIVAAAQMAGAHETIVNLPGAYDTYVGENGAALSGGQRQRIAFARALFGPVKLVVLDEPNANQDRAGEANLVYSLQRLKQLGITTVIIAHRPAILEHVDKVLIIQQGRMDTFGPKAEVFAKLNELRNAEGVKQ